MGCSDRFAPPDLLRLNNVDLPVYARGRDRTRYEGIIFKVYSREKEYPYRYRCIDLDGNRFLTHGTDLTLLSEMEFLAYASKP